MYESVYLDTAVSRFLFGDAGIGRRMFEKNVILFLSRRSAGLDIAVTPAWRVPSFDQKNGTSLCGTCYGFRG
jgi:hypothetical protein